MLSYKDILSSFTPAQSTHFVPILSRIEPHEGVLATHGG